MIGHTKSAAGVTGLMKVALALHHKVLPPTLHCRDAEPETPRSRTIRSSSTRSRCRGLRADADAPRRAGVSSFGFGGTNFHAVLEEYSRRLLATPRAKGHRRVAG